MVAFSTGSQNCQGWRMVGPDFAICAFCSRFAFVGASLISLVFLLRLVVLEHVRLPAFDCARAFLTAATILDPSQLKHLAVSCYPSLEPVKSLGLRDRLTAWANSCREKPWSSGPFIRVANGNSLDSGRVAFSGPCHANLNHEFYRCRRRKNIPGHCRQCK